MTTVQRQTRGIIALTIGLAMIPFFFFYLPPDFFFSEPVFSTQTPQSLIIEVTAEKGETGIYFVPPDIGAETFFQKINIAVDHPEKIKLESGASLRIIETEGRPRIEQGKMTATRRLALGLPVDVNLATPEELALIPGIGKKLAERIGNYREKNGRFASLDQLMNVKGIKEKKLAGLRRYLYIEKSKK